MVQPSPRRGFKEIRPFILLSFLASAVAFADDPAPKAVEEMSLDELMNVKVSVATKNAMSARESPGIVSVLTREEIQASGARDLVDLLRLVPGFDFGLDGWVPLGPSMRGIWGAEGRILVLWDGVSLNETTAGGIHLGNRYPIDQIKRIEIIRGPGSVVYGGYAEVAVVSITSLQAEDIDGVGVGATYGHGTKDRLRQNGNLVFGKAWDSVKVTVGAFAGEAQRTDQDDYFSSTGQRLDHDGNWDLKPFFLNAGVTAGNFGGRLLWDRYRMSQAVDYGSTNLATPQKQRFEAVNGTVNYAFRPASGLTLTPFLTRQWQKPWWVDSGPSIQNKPMIRDFAGFSANWELSPEWSLLGGAELMREVTEIEPGQGTFADGTTKVTFRNVAAYTQVQYTGAVVATVGARAEDHSSYGAFVVPRAAVTKILEPWHFKLLYAKAFRAPGMSNIQLGVDPKAIEPEKTRTVELEVGRQVGAGLLSLNLFDTSIDRPLVYLGATNQYQNQGETGSYGAELEYRYRPTWGFLNSSLSVYRADHHADFYAAPGDADHSLAAPHVKASVAAGWKLDENWTLGPSVVYLGKRFAYDWIPEQSAAGYRYFDAVWLLNLNATYSRGDWTASLAVMDLLDENPHYLQQYRGGQPSVPGPSREFVAKVRYGF